jgi:flagellar hook-associated protein 3 FlgL
MVNGFDSNTPRFLADLGRIQDRIERAQRQISSGMRVESASDAPEQVLEILRLKSRLDANTQVQSNLARVQAQVNTGEAAMREAVSLVERARVLAAQTGTTGALNRPTMAIEAQQLHARLLALVGTSAEGQFVFSGDGASGPSYVADSTQPNGVRLTAPSRVNSTLVADENNTTFGVALTASDAFDAPGAANAFQALQDLAKALTDDSETEVQAVMPNITKVLDHLNRQLAFYGHAQNRVTDALDAAKRSAVAMTADLSRLQEADLPSAILELNSANLQHQTALSARSQQPNSTLFDYLG